MSVYAFKTRKWSVFMNNKVHASIKIIFCSCFRNLLQPSGVELRPATFSLKVFRAEDIPQSKHEILTV